ncbi:MAG: hypothetical protein L0027_02655 [Candidatus Rokubacteria bacterium]|nr:hypothetical protein [Candidatus Rokubacteria bacterium]
MPRGFSLLILILLIAATPPSAARDDLRRWLRDLAAPAPAAAQPGAAAPASTAEAKPAPRIDLPLNTWVARKLPGKGKAPWSGKHQRLAHNPVNGRIYFLGGDYGGPQFFDSGRNEMYSYDIATDSWVQEQPYCRTDGTPQPSHPDEVGWVYDTRRNIFWMVPGWMGPNQKNCPESTLARFKIMTWDWKTRVWTVTDRQLPKHLVPGNSTFAQYDAKTDTILKLYNDSFNGMSIYDIAADRWTKVRYPGTPMPRFEKQYTALDTEKRQLYIVAGNVRRLYRYDLDKRSFEDLGEAPGKTGHDGSHAVWDPLNRVVLWPHQFQTSDVTLHVYHPDEHRWEVNVAAKAPEGITVRGTNAVFDPYQNAMLIMGQTGNEGKGNPYLFLYRYGDGKRAR